MTYILKLFDKYYLSYLEGDSYFRESYNPNEALAFKSRKAAVDWVRTNTNLSEYAKVTDKKVAIKEYESWVQNGMVRCKRPLINHQLSRLYNNEDKYEVLDWWITYHKSEEGCVKYENYITWPKLYNKFHHLRDVKRYGDSEGNTLLTFSISVSSKDTDIDLFREELNLVLPHVTYLEDKVPCLDIFDYICGEGGNFSNLLSHPNDVWEVKDRWQTLKKGSLEEVFNYIKTCRFYDR